jgi:hypothetical protein
MTAYDHEVLFELRDEPELLAVADALADVLEDTGQKRNRHWLALLAAGLAAAVIVGGTLALGTGGVESTLVDRALAAVGDEPVLHAVLRQQQPANTAVVELATGHKIVEPRVFRTEIWFDKERALEHTIIDATGLQRQDMLSTPQGVTSESGPVWTCARIAAHPVEATKAGVSCRLSGDNGTTPRHVPEPAPTLDPALAGFVDGYREALASGSARKVGDGTIDGQRVYWLEFKLPDPAAPGEPPIDSRERVAVDSESYRPLVVRPIIDGTAGQDYQVLEIETVGRDQADFSEPTPLRPEERQPASTNVVVTDEIELDGASQALGTRALWAGPEIAGLKLAGVQRQEVTTGYGPDSGLPPRVTPVVSFIYGGVKRRHPTWGSVEIRESTAPLNDWSFLAQPAPPGYMALNPFGWGQLRVGDVYVEITRFPVAGSEDLVIAAGKQLAPVPAP